MYGLCCSRLYYLMGGGGMKDERSAMSRHGYGKSFDSYMSLLQGQSITRPIKLSSYGENQWVMNLL